MMQNRRSRSVRATTAGVELLEAKRVSENFTRQALASRAGVSLDTLERLIKRDKVDRESVRRIVRALNLQPTEIVDRDEWEGNPTPTQPPEPGIQASIVMSYHGSNVDVAQQLCSQLQAVGRTVFMAGAEIRQSDGWFQRFTEGLKHWDGYILLVSPQSVLSEIMAEEVRQVRERYHTHNQPKIIPIYIGLTAPVHSDLDDYLVGLQFCEWQSPTDTAAIVESIQNLLTQDEQNPSATEPNLSVIQPQIWLNDPITEPKLPVGQVPLESAFYIERPPIEVQCYQEIGYPGALIRIKAPRQMGKTSLMARILHQARKQGYQTTHLSFQLATSEVLKDIDKLMRWFCLCVSRGLHLPNQLDEYWDDIFDGNYNSTVYFENYLLTEASSPVVLGLDEVDRVFAYPEIANDFFGLLRAWYEKAKYGDRDSDTWKKLRLIVIHSTEVYIPMNLNQSPFNVGLPIELPEFTHQQVQDLAQRYQLNWTSAQVEKLMQLVGGHPYLLQVAMYHVAHQYITLDQLLEQATTDSGIYRDHLRRYVWNLEQHPELATAFHEVVVANEPTPLKAILAFKLHSMGLVTITENRVQPRCQLYQRYFHHQFNNR